ncbi:MAG: ribonuclease P protein component [Gemmatimonadaceae bacterium]|nr:ribonuclease P protein component [Gemmatimonadaceae bacterium]NUQ92238.1 ribonuclease P protein component [Gemmatimonadaceae bacterium]NUR20159.1 ribonuclease P protein component [Gemmatimonadaceae bacterium]NUS98624.1 ribonuclease P protein component [Gemmatimonadaceae bacterium]
MTRGLELRVIARTGKRLRTEHLDVRVVASLSHAGHPRAGFVVPKHGRSAVERNRLKRRLREIVRTRVLPGAPPVDLVLTTRPSAYKLSFDALLAIGEHIRRETDRVAPRLLAASSSPPPEGE